MSPHQDFIDARRLSISRAVEQGRARGLSEEHMIVMLTDSQAERDTWPAPPPHPVTRSMTEEGMDPGIEDGCDVMPSSSTGLACVAMNVTVAVALLNSALCAVLVPTPPGFVRVLAFCHGAAFFTHARVENEDSP